MPIARDVVDVLAEVRKVLSTDQFYLMRACLTVQGGRDARQYTSYLDRSQPGNLNDARWLMKPSRVLRFYTPILLIFPGARLL